MSEKDDGTAWSQQSMAAEGWYDGTWKRLALENPDHWSSSSSSTSQAGWTRHGWGRHSPWSNQGWLQWNSPVDTTSNDPRQYGGERGEEAKPKNRPMSGAGDGRSDQMSLRQQLRRSLRRRESMSISHREMPRSRRFLELVLCKG